MDLVAVKRSCSSIKDEDWNPFGYVIVKKRDWYIGTILADMTMLGSVFFFFKKEYACAFGVIKAWFFAYSDVQVLKYGLAWFLSQVAFDSVNLDYWMYVIFAPWFLVLNLFN